MSVLVGSHVGKGGAIGWGRYCLRLDLSEVARRKAVPVVISDLGDDPYEIGMNAELLIEGTTRKNVGESLVLSFPAHEMNIDDPEHQRWVAEMAYELAKRAAPNAPVVVAVHTDSEGGKLHAHILVVNHDLSTGLSNQARMDIKHLRRINDRLMREEGLEVCNQNDKSKGRTWQEVMQDRKDAEKATAELLEANPDATPETSRLTIDDVKEKPTRKTSREFFRQEIDEAVVDAAAREVPGDKPSASLETLKETLSERNISMKILPDNGHGETVTFGAVDDDGMPVTVSRKSKSKTKPTKTSPVAAKDNQLGAAYTADALRERMQEVVRQRMLADHLRAEIDESIEGAGLRMLDEPYKDPIVHLQTELRERGEAAMDIGGGGRVSVHDSREDTPLWAPTSTDNYVAVEDLDTDGENEYSADRLRERVEGAYRGVAPAPRPQGGSPAPRPQGGSPAPRPQGGGLGTDPKPNGGGLTEGQKAKAADRAFLKKQSEAAKTKTKTSDIDFGD
ncbi:relaxase/mobilization nuclease domain-containing protein [Corynebacterium glyciniphilum]|uniref:relaxase/mobilization nuclease domain-containing protein n=1 Tax=Corynebacterium glyciniphilum TaxID=1404244 RepID=UPI0011AB3B0D|nr:relaxase/mobilization nuclease domain-containing protein [Corynebacterium glyciniphilum]